MWKKNKYYFLIGFSILAIWLVEFNKPKEINWFESYSKYDKIPYGNYILYNELSSLFSGNIITATANIEKCLQTTSAVENYLCINKSFYPEDDDLLALVNYVAKGNNACIISRSVPSRLLDTLGLEINQSFSNVLNDSLLFSIAATQEQFHHIGTRSFLVSYFNTDSCNTFSNLGTVSDTLMNFIRVPFEKGQFYLHLNPLLFTNYHMLKNNNHRYVSAVLSHLPNGGIMWDEYYKNRKNAISQSPLYIIIETPGLRQALYVAIIALLLYMLFASKRKQRIIPIAPVKSNDTLNFTRTIGQLYYNENNNKDIGTKRMEFFLADIRKRYNLSTNKLDNDFCQSLHDASKVPLSDIKELVKICNIIKGVQHITNARIIEQDKLIESFYKKTNYYG